jgi:hypothetical protein
MRRWSRRFRTSEENRRQQDRINALEQELASLRASQSAARPRALIPTADLQRHVEVLPGTASIRLFGGQWRDGVRYSVDGINYSQLPSDCSIALKGSLKVRFEGDFSTNNMFSGCSAVVAIKGEWFKCREAVDGAFYQMFYACGSLTAIPNGLFRHLVKAGSGAFHQMFYGCKLLTTIPGDLFRSLTTADGSAFYEMFQGCTSLTAIPENLFQSLTAGGDYVFQNMFGGCT